MGVVRLESVEVADFDERQVRVRTDRAGGPGGQHVNTTASAVRATYAPLGLSVRVSSERSQHQNRRKALVWLREEHERLQYLAFIYAYTEINSNHPSEADMQRFFQVTPPTVHQMVKTLHAAGLVARTPRQARTLRILVHEEDLPVLRRF